MIQTAIQSVESPEQITEDSRGSLIKTGKHIAFNKSGNVTLGKIISFKSSWKVTRPGVSPNSWWAVKFEMKVESESGEISTLKNPNSFVIL